MNIFENAKETKKGKSKPKTEVIVNDKEFQSNLHRLIQINKEKAVLEADEKRINAQIKEYSIDEFSKLYEKTEVYPGSFDMVVGGNPKLEKAGFMVIPTDKYLTIDEDYYNYLHEKFGDEMVDRNVTYQMDTALVEKYGSIISTLILKCKDIPEADKLNLISKKVSYSVKKGVIETLKVNFNQRVKDIITEISPVFMKKNVRIIE